MGMTTIMPRHAGVKLHKINVKATWGQEWMLKRAAAATGCTVSDFILGQAMTQARRILEDHRWRTTPEEEFDASMELLRKPIPARRPSPPMGQTATVAQILESTATEHRPTETTRLPASTTHGFLEGRDAIVPTRPVTAAATAPMAPAIEESAAPSHPATDSHTPTRLASPLDPGDRPIVIEEEPPQLQPVSRETASSLLGLPVTRESQRNPDDVLGETVRVSPSM
ncbi:MAG: DUF1778 domain-containing protein [Propionibacteriaceae bacterium]|jgi:uncharacterized protein (DUF1778 family)|nr:DUF1778 domain-containing protein [Propionibacteriaceae bacterium]